jgi:heptosyltransferase II
MKILVRLPNWLGDLVMSVGFVQQLRSCYPDARIDVIVKKGIHQLCDFIPGINGVLVFDKAEFPGLKGAGAFGISLSHEKYDLAFSLPDSFSSAFMLWRTGAKTRVGYKKELRSFLLTHSYHKPKNKHRVDQYVSLLEQFKGASLSNTGVNLQQSGQRIDNRIVINVNSEADSRRLPVNKAIAVINLLRKQTDAEFLLVGSPKERPHVSAVYDALDNKTNVHNLAGTTDLVQLIQLFSQSKVMLTTDSGPMHLANALGVHTVALEGASDEKNTAPYNSERSTLIRYGKLDCEPCVKNTCKFGQPECLLRMDDQTIVNAVLSALHQKTNQ